MTPSRPSRDEVDKEIAAQRRRGDPLRDQLLWRISRLGGDVDLTTPENFAAFQEVWDGFTVPGLVLRPPPGKSRASAADGGTILIQALLVARGTVFGLIQRRLLLGPRLANHQVLYIHPAFRGHGINLALLERSFDFYDELELDAVYLQAAMATGRWHWARVGFDFVRAEDRNAVRDWALEVVRATGVRGLRVDRYTSANQFAFMGGNRKLSLGAIAQAMPSHATRINEVAQGNGLTMDERIALGRAVMLTGPTWFGSLELRGPGRAVFRAYAAGKVARMARP